ncbi:hypothetical protein SAMN05444392_11366 [Seinonella peptonophila]|uniref:Metanogen output domain-containing protein n=1 Tax=Seinonella peptonophila TaxID=112248 RepID=A0A1M5AEN0_9BACL|nr:hypothetical protein SAMN05444392_11366 [Seinonella peptonophila]
MNTFSLRNYDTLTIEILDTVVKHLGQQELKKILISMTESRVREWESRLLGLSLSEKIVALKEVYSTNDTFMEIEDTDDSLKLIEHNCPFYNIAMEQPILCSVTVSVLTRLLGYQVIREKSFQNGDERCVFRVLQDHPIDPDTYRFSEEHEPPKF